MNTEDDFQDVVWYVTTDPRPQDHIEQEYGAVG